MTSLEKVIEGLETCTGISDDCAGHGCPYWDFYGEVSCRTRMELDAIALLKEQEAVEPKTEPSAKGYWYTCGVCGWWLFEVRDTVHFDDRKRIHFCASCGRSVRWNDIRQD